MITILVANPKGGSGKTTIATNLAAAFAAGGLRTALADADRQGSSLYWLKLRPKSVAKIIGVDWSKQAGKVPKDIDRLVIDCAAGLRIRDFRRLVAMADVAIVPILPSPFDERATARFVKRIQRVGRIRKSRTPAGVVLNRVRPRTRATSHLDSFVRELSAPAVGQIRDRALYTEVAAAGLGVFDLPVARIEAVKADWYPLLRFIETAGWRD